MKIFTTRPLERDYTRLPRHIKKLADKKFEPFLRDPKHPSLRIKKMEDPRNIWEGSITESYRFTFQMQSDTSILRRIGTHDILRTP